MLTSQLPLLQTPSMPVSGLVQSVPSWEESATHAPVASHVWQTGQGAAPSALQPSGCAWEEGRQVGQQRRASAS